MPNLIAQSPEERARQFQTSRHQEKCINPQLQEELNRFKEIQKNPQLLLQTLLEMEHKKQLRVSLVHYSVLN